MIPSLVDVLVIGGGATGAGILRDLSRRGLRCLLVDKSDMGTGTSGRYHGLLHSGGRYVSKDPIAARECIDENRVLRRIAPHCIEDTGGLFVATRDDPADYVEAFPEASAACGVPCEEVPLDELFRREPALDRSIWRAYRVPDASLEPWQLIEANLADARAHGSQAVPYQRVVGMTRNGAQITSVELHDERSGSLSRVAARMVVSAAGAWAGRVAALAGVELAMSPGKGTMLVYNQRMTDTVVNRCHRPGDGDIMVPVHLVAILGTTEIRVDDPDRYGISREEVMALIAEGSKLFPDLPRMRLLRAYAGVRPLYQLEPPADPGDVRGISRAHVVIDHEQRDGVRNLVSIVGGKLTTYRLMAEQTADAVAAKLGVSVRCTTAEDALPGADDRHYYWLGHRLAEHEHQGGGDAELICECEIVTRDGLERFLDEHWPCSLDDVRRGTRLGMGPCQGGFCTFRAVGAMARRGTRDGDAPGRGADDRSPPESGAADDAAEEATLAAFVEERYKGIRPIVWGRQLQELWLTTGIYAGVLGVGAPRSAPQALVSGVNASRVEPTPGGRDGQG
ncbi:MAG TPA: anaerobic glycerol-3-phosphate dehydrogenase subunit GlpA [Candidatus Limnocylindrales bacterium]|nr:anaerobic glycerol-3-phosphate dehydrogenase subunit GlpA [Candidatus Limnocylindrales bacterium]